MRTLVTGAGGMLGREVVRVLPDAVGLTRAELDVTDAAAVRSAIADVRPAAIVNCAAYTDVDRAESEEATATAVNATPALADAAGDALLVYPSTDYVFDGEKGQPYVESDSVAPRSAYGRSKLAGELVTAHASRHLIVRTAWLFGAGGRNFVDTMLELEGELKVVADQVGCPTYAGHLAEALATLLERGATGVVHAAATGACSWFEFAVEIFRQAGRDVTLTACRTPEYPRPAPRPASSVLVSERADAPRLPHWRSGLASYLAERAAVR